MNLEIDGEDLTREEAIAQLVTVLEDVSEILSALFPRMHKRPILGGIFGEAGYVLCSYCYTVAGLQDVRYYVYSEHGLFLGYGATRADALKMAREFLTALPLSHKNGLVAKFKAKQEAKETEARLRLAEARAEMAATRESQPPKVRSIGRRRSRIFEESHGKCHYCGTALTLDGKWHVEHKMPKALGGGDEPGNLVASCVRCNHRKNDKTDIEFKAQLLREATNV